MGKLKEITPKYCYNDVMIKPAVLSTINHRAECDPFDKDGNLPLFTAPMDSVVGLENFELYEKHGIIPILPRTVGLKDRLSYAVNGKWAAFSLNEFEEEFTKGEKISSDNIKALIDMANGHMTRLYEDVRKAKRIYGGGLQIMVGNIANPETYRVCAESQVDFVRCSVGTGSGCTTCSNTGVGYPIASLINEIAEIKAEMIERGADESKLPKIIADGGIRCFRDITKSLALGADYIMIGSVFSMMLESSACKFCNSEDFLKLPLTVTVRDIENAHLDSDGWRGKYNGKEIYLGDISARFYGMASRAGQIALNGKKTRTSEGIEKTLPVLYTMSTWVDNFKDFLRSAMSYTNSKNLDDFRKSDVIVASANTVMSINA